MCGESWAPFALHARDARDDGLGVQVSGFACVDVDVWRVDVDVGLTRVFVFGRGVKLAGHWGSFLEVAWKSCERKLQMWKASSCTNRGHCSGVKDCEASQPSSFLGHGRLTLASSLPG